MLFNSYEFLLVFLPLAFVLFWYGGRSIRWRLGLLTFASYLFYSWWQFRSWDDFIGTFHAQSLEELAVNLWHWRFTIIMLLTSSVDYWAARWIVAAPPQSKARRRALLALSLSANLGLLGFFKYFGFFTQITNDLSQFVGGGPLPVVALILPVGISFYTFESMSYVIDIYRGVATPAKSYLDYACFISFFPHLVAGPIIRYSDMLHQFRDANWVRPRPDWSQVNVGLLFFTIGMAKKLLIADIIAQNINPLWAAFGTGSSLGVAGSWAAVLGYTFRIYFDFSAYSDMAVGIGHMFAVKLPQNFNSPYKATDPIDFWRRWHISLSSWLRDYLYFPLGGNRTGKQVRNLMITMLLGGLWHGAAWLFVIWGAWHGLLLVVFHKLRNWRLVPSNDRRLGYWFNRQLTFFLVVIGWVFFRAADVRTSSYGYSSVSSAVEMMAQMIGWHGSHHAAELSILPGYGFWAAMAACWLWCNFAPNSFEVAYTVKLRKRYALLAGAIMGLCILRLGTPVDFLYFRF
ncbi:MAG: MBOAT family O-acyltransferase [Thermoguttaceae bacterium]